MFDHPTPLPTPTPTPTLTSTPMRLPTHCARQVPCSVFGSFGWSGEAVDMMEKRLKVGRRHAPAAHTLPSDVPAPCLQRTGHRACIWPMGSGPCLPRRAQCSAARVPDCGACIPSTPVTVLWLNSQRNALQGIARCAPPGCPLCPPCPPPPSQDAGFRFAFDPVRCKFKPTSQTLQVGPAAVRAREGGACVACRGWAPPAGQGGTLGPHPPRRLLPSLPLAAVRGERPGPGAGDQARAEAQGAARCGQAFGWVPVLGLGSRGASASVGLQGKGVRRARSGLSCPHLLARRPSRDGCDARRPWRCAAHPVARPRLEPLSLSTRLWWPLPCPLPQWRSRPPARRWRWAACWARCAC